MAESCRSSATAGADAVILPNTNITNKLHATNTFSRLTVIRFLFYFLFNKFQFYPIHEYLFTTLYYNIRNMGVTKKSQISTDSMFEMPRVMEVPLRETSADEQLGGKAEMTAVQFAGICALSGLWTRVVNDLIIVYCNRKIPRHACLLHQDYTECTLQITQRCNDFVDQ